MSDCPEGRVPPHNLEAEESVLGMVVLRNSALAQVVERGLEPDDFYHPAHRAIFEAMIALDGASQPIDPITVAEQLKRVDRGRGIQDADKLVFDFLKRVATAENVGYYVEIVRANADLRRLIALCAEISGKAFDARGDGRALLDQAAAATSKLADRSTRTTYVPISKLVVPAVQRITKLHERGVTVTGVTTGYPELDALLAGFQPGELIVLAARPSEGKTALALNFAENAGVPTLIFSMEMSAEALVDRAIACEGQLDGQAMRTARLEGKDWIRLTKGAGKVSQLPIYVDDTPAQTIFQIRAKAMRWANDRSVFPEDAPETAGPRGMIMLDYLQLVLLELERGESRDTGIGRVTRALKNLAKALRMPVVALSQLNRKAVKGERPNLGMLRESGNIEGDADVVQFIYDPDDENAPMVREIIVGKQRNGPTGTVKLVLVKEQSHFVPLEWREEREMDLPYGQTFERPRYADHDEEPA